jgi:uncharacterized protein
LIFFAKRKKSPCRTTKREALLETKFIENGSKRFSIPALEKRYKFTYLPSIAFENEKSKKEILARGLAEFNSGKILPKALLLGKKYKSKIEASFFPKVQIQWISKWMGYGLFAAEKLKAGSFLGEYTGIVRRNDRRYFEPLNNYCYEYPVPDSIGRSHVIDATSGNLSRFINHSFHPNLKPVHVFVDGFFHLILLTIREIERGEQLSYNYGRSYWYIRSPPIEINAKKKPLS